MYSVGTDILEIARMARLIEHGDEHGDVHCDEHCGDRKSRFFEKYYSKDELAELKQRGFPKKSAAPTAAGMFCAKEAFSKALGTGVVGFSLKEVSLLHKPNGMPYLCLSGRAKQLAEAQKLQFSVSISHTDTLANAVVIAFCE